MDTKISSNCFFDVYYLIFYVDYFDLLQLKLKCNLIISVSVLFLVNGLMYLR